MTIKKLNKNLIAITIGDIDGIGINLLLSEVRKKNIRNFILFTNIKIFKECSGDLLVKMGYELDNNW